LVASVKLLDNTYKTEQNGDVRERLLLVRRVLADNEQAARVAEKEFRRSMWWAYEWLNLLIYKMVMDYINTQKEEDWPNIIYLPTLDLYNTLSTMVNDAKGIFLKAALYNMFNRMT
jgi:hypothetical protein